LTSLLESLTGVERVLPDGAAAAHYDFHCPLLSLPLAFRTTLDTIPANVPYLFPAVEKVAQWRAIIGHSSGLTVGLAWSGNPKQGNDHNRSIALQRLASLVS